jgi:hypothetical protein
MKCRGVCTFLWLLGLGVCQVGQAKQKNEGDATSNSGRAGDQLIRDLHN